MQIFYHWRNQQKCEGAAWVREALAPLNSPSALFHIRKYYLFKLVQRNCTKLIRALFEVSHRDALKGVLLLKAS